MTDKTPCQRCGEPTIFGVSFCRDCRKHLRQIKDIGCSRCHGPLYKPKGRICECCNLEIEAIHESKFPKLVRPFFIDHGELHGCNVEQAFSLGYECARIDALIKEDDAFTVEIHAENFKRIQWNLDKHHRRYNHHWLREDAGEVWIKLIVEEDNSDNDD